MTKLEELEYLIQENNNSIQRLSKLVSTPVYSNSSNNINSSNVIKNNRKVKKVLKEK